MTLKRKEDGANPCKLCQGRRGVPFDGCYFSPGGQGRLEENGDCFEFSGLVRIAP